MFVYPLFSEFHEHSYSRRRSVEYRDSVFLYHLPPPILSGIVRRSFKNERCYSQCQGSINIVRVPCDPTYVGRAPPDVFLVRIETPLARTVSPDQVTTSAMLDSFGFARCSRCVKYEQWFAGFHRLRRETSVWVPLSHFFMGPDHAGVPHLKKL